MSTPNQKLNGRRVVLGLSGGVDSAVAALRLRDQGADVQALHMTNWEDDDGYCTAAKDLQDAREVCQQLDVPLHHVNFAREYRDRVFNYFLEEYRAGRTPNPDVLCNREIKFGVFREYAHRLGGELLATGHYARIEHGEHGPALLKATDRGKDQSYFLHAVSAEALAETVFPLGDLQKSEVRTIARDHGLATSEKKDSTGICFIGERPFREFLASFLPANPGPICTPDQQQIGEHHGLMYYTLGQRQGLGLGGRRDSPEGAWYVAGKDLARNTLIVVQGEHPLLYSSQIEVSDESWIGGAPPELQSPGRLECKVKVRYRQPDQECRIERLSGQILRVSFPEPQRAVAPGQFAVFYAGDHCLGGAVISRVVSAETGMQDAIPGTAADRRTTAC
jgi:tRNA-specific 2-thiouridylase